MAGRATPATTLLANHHIAHTLRGYAHDPRHESYGAEAAEALDLDPARVFKTLVAEVDGTPVVAVVPVAGQLNLKALAAAVGAKKATMASVERAARITGYVPGGISPLGLPGKLAVVVDASAVDHERVHCSAGRRGLEMELAPADLIRLSGARVAPIATVAPRAN